MGKVIGMGKRRFAYRAHILFFLLYFACSFTLFWCSAKDVGFNFGLSLMLVWNVFLSFLPLLFAHHAVSCRDGQKRIWLLWAFLWLIFWPNTFYMVTDIAHFTGNSFFTAVPYQEPVYSTSIQLWAKGILIVAGILYGVLNGIKSEMIFENRVIDRCGKGKRIFFRAICSILGGAAVYIGRFLRLNSWDIFRPLKIAAAFQGLGHGWRFVSGFIGIFAAFIFIVLSFAKPLAGEDTN